MERLHRYLNHSLRAAKLQGFNVHERLPEILQFFRATPHAATGRTPALLLQHREINTDIPLTTTKGSDIDYSKYQNQMKLRHDGKLRTLVTYFKVRDLVWSLVPPTNKSDPIFPSTVRVVIGIKGERTYEIVNAKNGYKVVRSGSFLRSVSFSPPPIAESIQPSPTPKELPPEKRIESNDNISQPDKPFHQTVQEQEDRTTSINDSPALEPQPSPTTLRRST